MQSSAAQSEAARLQAELAAQRAQHEAEMARREADHTAALAQREAETETRVRSEDVAVGAEAKSLVQEYTEHAKQQEVCGPWLLLLLLMLPGLGLIIPPVWYLAGLRVVGGEASGALGARQRVLMIAHHRSLHCTTLHCTGCRFFFFSHCLVC